MTYEELEKKLATATALLRECQPWMPFRTCDASRKLDAFLANQPAAPCMIPPDGWTCSRGEGHSGPCAASPVIRDDTPLTENDKRMIDEAWEKHAAARPAAPSWCTKCNSVRPCPGCTIPAAPSLDVRTYGGEEARDAFAAARAEAVSAGCMSCDARGRVCDGGDHCDNCGARMDGDIAATADVCHDCWRAAKDRTVYEVWIGSEKTKDRIVKETTDIEDAARTACADLSVCTFWGMKAPTRTEAEQVTSPRLRRYNMLRGEMFEHPDGYYVRFCDVALARTEAEQRVLDAMAGIELGVLEAIRDKQSCAPVTFHPPCLAELARREAEK